MPRNRPPRPVDGRTGTKDRDRKKARFLSNFRKLRGKQYVAAEATGIHYNTVWEWRQIDEAFDKKYIEILEASTDKMEIVAEERAEKKSDLLMMFTLKGRRPDKFRDTAKVTHDGALTIRALLLDDEPQPAKQPAAKGRTA